MYNNATQYFADMMKRNAADMMDYIPDDAQATEVVEE